MESSSTLSTAATSSNSSATTVYSSSTATTCFVTPKSSSSSSTVTSLGRRYKSTSCLFPNVENTLSPNLGNSADTISCYNSSGVSELSSSIQPVFSPTSTATYVPTHSSAYLTTPTSSLMDSYLNTSLSTLTSSSPFSITRASPIVLSGSVPSVLANPSPDPLTQLVSQLVSTPQIPAPLHQDHNLSQNIASSSPLPNPVYESSAPIQTLSSIATSVPLSIQSPSEATNIASEHITTIPLWKRKPNPGEMIPGQCEFEVDPVSLQQILVYLVSKVDGLSAQYAELESRQTIMQNSLFTSLSKNIDTKFDRYCDNLDSEFCTFKSDFHAKLNELNNDSSFQKCHNMCEKLKSEFDKKFDDIQQDNDDLRKVWDLHMDRIRTRIQQQTDSEDDSEDDDIAPDPTHRSNFKILSAALEKLKKENLELDRRLIHIEQYTRRESLVFSGVPGSITQENLQSFMHQVMFNLGFKHLQLDDISACHRMWSPPNSREPARVIIKFVNRKVVEWSLAHSENLKQVKEAMGIELSMSENLCDKNTESAKICKWLKENGRIYDHFTRNGFSKVVLRKGEQPEKITHPGDLRYKFADIPDIIP